MLLHNWVLPSPQLLVAQAGCRESGGLGSIPGSGADQLLSDLAIGVQWVGAQVRGACQPPGWLTKDKGHVFIPRSKR